jgi:nanoRNase/pAp phosphatase (c-di-AMP/oligoRNAs hydrolase)
VIDHHQRSGPPIVDDDIRQVGSCSAIMWEYLMEAGLDWESEEGAKIATALALGIMTDTKNGAVDSAASLDFDALSHCMKYKDNNLYKRIVNYPKPGYWHDLYVKAWGNKKEHGAVLVTGIGNLTAAQSGIISDLAEKFAETEGVTTAVVFAMVEGNVDISVRSTNSSLNVDEFVKHAFGGGGGKRGAGRCRLDIPLFQGIPDAIQDNLFAAISETIVHKALQFANDGVGPKGD